jgi:hypothetical protein
MNEYHSSLEGTDLVRPASSTTSGAPIAGKSGDAAAAVPSVAVSLSEGSAAQPVRKPKARRVLTKKQCRRIVVAAMLAPMIGFSVGLPASPVAAQPASNSQAAGPRGSAGGGSNARSAPAAGGSSGTVTSASQSGFTMTTAAGQKVTVDEASSTTYKKGSSSISASAIKKGAHVLVIGTVSSTTIKATQVLVQTGSGS